MTNDNALDNILQFVSPILSQVLEAQGDRREVFGLVSVCVVLAAPQ